LVARRIFDAVSTATAVMIRPYRADDFDACRICVAELQDVGRAIDPRLRLGDSMAEAYLEQMQARCQKFSGAILVADHGGGVVGFVMVLARVPFESLDEPPGSGAWIAELVVRSGFRGKGIGRALLQAGERYAWDAGATELRIGVMSENRRARELYLEEGFKPYSEVLAKIR